MTAILTLAFLAQLQVNLSPVSKPVTQRILGKRVANTVTSWVVGLTLDPRSDGAVSVVPSAVLSRIPQLGPLDHQAVSQLIGEAATNSPWARAGRLALDVTALATFFGASTTTATGALRWGQKPLFWLSATSYLGPQAAARLRGTATPVQQNFEALAWTAPISLQPGESGTAHVFTVAWTNPQAISFVIETGGMVAAKVVK